MVSCTIAVVLFFSIIPIFKEKSASFSVHFGSWCMSGWLFSLDRHLLILKGMVAECCFHLAVFIGFFLYNLYMHQRNCTAELLCVTNLIFDILGLTFIWSLLSYDYSPFLHNNPLNHLLNQLMWLFLYVCVCTIKAPYLMKMKPQSSINISWKQQYHLCVTWMSDVFSYGT